MSFACWIRARLSKNWVKWRTFKMMLLKLKICIYIYDKTDRRGYKRSGTKEILHFLISRENIISENVWNENRKIHPCAILTGAEIVWSTFIWENPIAGNWISYGGGSHGWRDRNLQYLCDLCATSRRVKKNLIKRFEHRGKFPLERIHPNKVMITSLCGYPVEKLKLSLQLFALPDNLNKVSPIFKE